MDYIFQEDIIEDIRGALQAVRGLTLLRVVLEDEPAQAVLRLLHALSAEDREPEVIASSYSLAFVALAQAANHEGVPPLEGVDDAWRAYLLGRLLDTENLWNTQLERYGYVRLARTLQRQAERDLRVLQYLFGFSAEGILQATMDAVLPTLPALRDAWVPWRGLASLSQGGIQPARAALVLQILECQDWAQLGGPLEEYWSRYGSGELARYTVLRWQGVTEGLRGIAHPDPIQLASLIGYERQQNILKANTERFLAGLPAHDVLLYGTPGTGKSSTVKALANAYAEQGLRLVEVHKEYIVDLPRIVALLRGRAPRFLLFIDDLSFEEHETAYKVLKMLLEGTAEARPRNILIYATTNRLNLVRENFSDRGKPTDDTNWRDTMDEKQSLVHRFALRVTFATPDQERYLAIVQGLARQRGIELPEEILRARALQWERQHHGGRSGRVARQFVDDLEA